MRDQICPTDNEKSANETKEKRTYKRQNMMIATMTMMMTTMMIALSFNPENIEADIALAVAVPAAMDGYALTLKLWISGITWTTVQMSRLMTKPTK